MDHETTKKKRAKNIALLIALVGLVLLFYGLAVVRIKVGH